MFAIQQDSGNSGPLRGGRFATTRWTMVVAAGPKDSLGYALRAIARRASGQPDAALEDHDRAVALCDVEAELPERLRTYYKFSCTTDRFGVDSQGIGLLALVRTYVESGVVSG